MTTLELHDVHKRFGGVVALRGARLSARGGEVHALLGANGSGKSTLSKVLTGIVAPDRADLRLDGEPLRVTRPQDAHARGIVAVYQELSLVPDLTVAANVSLAVEPTTAGFVRRRAVRDRAVAVLDRFRHAFSAGRLPVDERVRALSPSEQQVVEIAKGLARHPRVLVLDEATASLHREQVAVLVGVVRELREQGVLVVFTSHRMAEVFEVCDRATVLRNGEAAGTVELAGATTGDLVELMAGRALERAGDGARDQRRSTAGPAREAEAGERQDGGEGDERREGDGRQGGDARDEGDACDAREGPGGARQPRLAVHSLTTSRLREVSFTVAAGEVLGLGGLAGQGQSDVLAALFGAERVRGGTVAVDGRQLRVTSPAMALRAGLALVPGDRGRQGVLAKRSILENLTLPSAPARALPVLGALSRGRERAAARRQVDDLGIRLGSLDDPVSTLSGGNQQKVVVGKWLLTGPRVVLLDDPTKGIDVGAKAELYRLVRRLTGDGVCVVLNSSDDEELLALSDRVAVLVEGRVVAELAGGELSLDRLVAASLLPAAGAAEVVA